MTTMLDHVPLLMALIAYARVICYAVETDIKAAMAGQMYEAVRAEHARHVRYAAMVRESFALFEYGATDEAHALLSDAISVLEGEDVA